MTGGTTKEPLRFVAYPNVGALQGEVEILLPAGASIDGAREAVARCVLGGTDPSRVRLFSAHGNGAELATIPELRREAEKGGVFASAGQPLRHRGKGPPQVAHSAVSDTAPRRYDAGLVGSSVLRADAQDPELPILLQSPVPVVVVNSGLVGRATECWNFDYLDRGLSDVDNFYVLCAPPQSEGRFAYYDLAAKKNPCGYDVAPTNERVEMRFPDFRRKVADAQKRRKDKKKVSSFYLQNTLLHREENEPGPPQFVGGFGSNCGVNIAKDIIDFEWDWLKAMMGDRHPQMCQFFCGVEGGFSPCHYDPQDNLFVQVRGYKRVLLFHPRHFGCLYPWPVHHPQDRQSRVDFGSPDLGCFPRFRELQGCGLEAVLGPGDALRIPPGWWHHIEMLPSKGAEVVSINFWYPPPKWFHGDILGGEIFWDKPLFGVRRVLFQRCVEELIGQSRDPASIQEVIGVCLGSLSQLKPREELQELVNQVISFVSTVFTDPAECRELLSEVVEGRFVGLTRKNAQRAGA